MMENENNEIESEFDENSYILELPDHILLQIISYIDITADLALSCKKFYQLVCWSSRNDIPLNLCYKELCDPLTFLSVMKSERQFDDLIINLCNCQVLTDIFFNRIVNLLKKYGPKIKQLTIWNSIQSKPTEMCQSMLYEILSLTNNIEKFTFRNIYVSETGDINDKELDLHKLRTLVLDYVLLNSAKVLLKIPKNILTELTFTFEPYSEVEFQDFFNRQANIKKLEIFENDKIDFSHLRLEHLKISSNINFPLMIQQQPNLRYLDFAITWVSDDTILEVCKLKHLEVLKTLVDLVSNRVFKGFNELSNLKELRLDSHSSYDMGYLSELSMMRGLRLEKLTFLFSERKIHSEVIIQMANNFHYLKHIELINRSIAVLDTLVQNLPTLETILLDYFAVFGAPEDTLIISDESPKKNLKQLVVIHVNVNELENGRNLLKLVNICPNLERLMLSKLVNFGKDDLENILQSHINLTHLSIETDEFEFNEDTVQMIFKYGVALKHFRLSGMSKCLAYKTLKEIFRNKFPILNMYKYSSGDIELVMRKRKVDDWHQNFKLMDHF
ncbi:uncharacterized protein [Chironomus tepperi]|uniref:uncharacterized protein n=1 Tax=Chironomus tepperi TaxID=113505 RepID=UPI00391F4466